MTGPVSPAAHPRDELLVARADAALGAVATAAVDLHATGCPRCRYALNEAVARRDADRLETNLLVITAELDAPRPRLVERTLVRFGCPRDTARLLVATPSLRRSWFITLGVALLFGVLAANPDRPDSTLVWFLALAPLVPVVGVALAYGPGVDPAYEITVAAPTSGIRLVLIRAIAVLSTSIVAAGGLSLLMLERHTAMVGAWLVPALALTAVCLALMTVMAPRIAASAVVVAWLALVIVVSGGPDALALFGAGGQVAVALIGLAAAVVLGWRRGSFDVAEGGVG